MPLLLNKELLQLNELFLVVHTWIAKIDLVDDIKL